MALLGYLGHTCLMADTLTPLICDLLEWIGRTSCPRLPVWEEATDQGLVARKGPMVELTPRGRQFLANRP